MLLNKFFITKVQHEHTCSNIISKIYTRSEDICFGGHLLITASKHDENCPITLVFHQISQSIFFRAVTARENQ